MPKKSGKVLAFKPGPVGKPVEEPASPAPSAVEVKFAPDLAGWEQRINAMDAMADVVVKAYTDSGNLAYRAEMSKLIYEIRAIKQEFKDTYRRVKRALKAQGGAVQTEDDDDSED